LAPILLQTSVDPLVLVEHHKAYYPVGIALCGRNLSTLKSSETT